MPVRTSNREQHLVILPDDQNNLVDQGGDQDEQVYGIVEGNLYKHHFGSLASHAKARETKISEVVEKGVDAQGRAFTRKWKVKGDVELGYPTWLDEKVLVAVIDMGRRRSFPVQNPIPVSISTLCRQVGMSPDSGRNRETLRTSLKRIRGVGVEASGTFFFKRKKAYIDDSFSVLQRVVFAGEELDDGTVATCTYVWLSDKILANVNDCHIVPMDTRFFMKLTPTAGRLYQLISTRFFGLFMELKKSGEERDGRYIVETYHDLCRRMPLEAQSFPSLAKQQFLPAHKQLLNSGFLSRVEWLDNQEIRYYPGLKAAYDFDNAMREITRQLALPLDVKRLGNGGEGGVPVDIEGRRRRKTGAVTLEILPEVIGHLTGPERAATGLTEAYTQQLKSRGVSPRQAKELAGEFWGAETEWQGRTYPLIAFYVEYFDWLVARNHEKQPDSGAWLVGAIREQWQPVREFKPQAQVAAETEAAQQAGAAAQQRKEAAERRSRGEADRRAYEQWLAKSPEQRWSQFLFEMEFKREQGREPTPQEVAEARAAFVADPETPEAYQVRMFGQVKFPVPPQEIAR